MISEERRKELDGEFNELTFEEIRRISYMSKGKRLGITCSIYASPDKDLIEMRYLSEGSPDFYLKCIGSDKKCLEILCPLFSGDEKKLLELEKDILEFDGTKDLFEGLPKPEEVAYIISKLKQAEKI